MGGFGGGGGGGTLQQQGLALLLYGSLNLFLNFFNKWALSASGAGFSYPVFYSMFHMLMSLVGSRARSHTVGPLSPLSPSHGLFRGETRLA